MSITTNKAASADGRLALAAGAQRTATCAYALLDTAAFLSACLLAALRCDQCLVLLGTNSPPTIRSHPFSGLTARSLLQES